MKGVSIKNIQVGTVFRFCAGAGLVLGVLTGLILSLVGRPLPSLPIPFLRGLRGIPESLVGGAIYGIGAGIAGSILALLYNIFSTFLGGIKVTINESDK